MTVEQNICIVPKLLKYDRARCLEIAREMLSLVNMPYEDYAHKYPVEMSGGQQQRIGVLRALAASPPIVLMDEPFGALDPMTRSVLQEEVKKIQRKLNKAVVFVTHDMDEAISMADKIIFMDRGSIVQIATPDEMLENPANDLIRGFMGKRSKDAENQPRTTSEFMNPRVYAVDKKFGKHEAINFMKSKHIDTLLIKNPDGTCAGIVSIQSIRDHGKDVKTIEPLITQDYVSSYVDEDAHVCFDKLFSTSGSYVVVLNNDNTIAGIVTKTSMAKALAETVWGD